MRVARTLFLLWALAVPGRAQEIGPSAGAPQLRSGDKAHASAFWLDVPFFPQRKNGCGASSLAMIVQYWHSDGRVDPESIFSALYSEKLKGIPASRMKSYLEKNGFLAFSFAGSISDLEGHLLKGRPLIVSLGAGSSLHYVVVVGLDRRQKLILLNDPAVKKLSALGEPEFLAAWRQTNYWTLLAVPNARP